MKLFFEPQTVALIGATAGPYKPGNNLGQNLEATFGDRWFPINPKGGSIGNRTCYPSVGDLPEPVDLAIIFIPAAAVPAALEECGQAGIKRAIIESGGFAEVGAEGLELHDRCLKIARRHGLRIWGPNCMGAINVTQMKVMSFLMPALWEGRFFAGPVSLVVQSGMLSAGFLARILTKTPFGLSKVASIGNKLDVDEVDVLEYLLADPDTGVIGLYLESLSRGRRFFELAQGSAKPIVVLKSGRTAFGAKAAASHTAALAQDDAVLDAALRQAGVVRARGMLELMDLARSFGVRPLPRLERARVAVLTFSGGAGVVSADELYDHGLELARLGPNTLKKIKTVYPEWMDPENPVDLYPGMEKHGPAQPVLVSLEAVLEDPNVDAALVHIFAPPIKAKIYDLDRFGELVNRHRKPVVFWVLGAGDAGEELTHELEKRGAPVVDEISKGVRIIQAMTLRK